MPKMKQVRCLGTFAGTLTWDVSTYAILCLTAMTGKTQHTAIDETIQILYLVMATTEIYVETKDSLYYFFIIIIDFLNYVMFILYSKYLFKYVIL
jgi:hypothetical protein